MLPIEEFTPKARVFILSALFELEGEKLGVFADSTYKSVASSVPLVVFLSVSY